MRTIRRDIHKRCDFYENIDGHQRITASLIFRHCHDMVIELPQRGHSFTDEDGNFRTHLSHETLQAMGEFLEGVSYDKGVWKIGAE